jgi:hypothetical protein
MSTRASRSCPGGRFARRLLGHFIVAPAVIFESLGAMRLGGNHLLEKLPWLDALLNASMILGGMGPVDAIRSPVFRETREYL